jgi:hypothetical protein
MTDASLSPSEERLVAAVKAGAVLDLTAGADPEKTLHASIIRKILLRHYTGQTDVGRIQIRGACIEGDLDLTGIQTNAIIEFRNCRVSRILLDNSTIPHLALNLGGGQAEIKWLGTLGTINKTAAKNAALVTAFLFAFIIIKVFYIAHGNTETALGVFNSAGPTTVIVGALLSVFPLISALLLGLALFELSRGSPPPFVKAPPFIRRDYDAVWVILLAAAVACLFLTPWPIMVTSVVLGLASGFALRLSSIITKRIKEPWFKLVLTCIGWVFLSLSFVVFILNPVMYAVWLPHEILTFSNGGSPEAGYVLSDSNGWVSQLRSGQRRIYRYRSEDVTSRTLCRGGQSLPSMPFVPSSLTSPDSLWQTIYPSSTKKLPKCF